MRTIIAAAFACSMGLGAGQTALAQNNAPTTVQLPTFSFFTVQTTVSVPDGGGAYLGGVSRAYNSSTARGLPFWAKTPWLSPLGASRGIASGVDAGGVSVHATIIDHEELDKAVLSEAAARRSPPTKTDLEAERLSRHSSGEEDATAPPASVAAIRAEQSAEAARQAEKAAALLSKAQEMEKANKPGQARIYYRMAARLAGEDVKQQIATRLAELK